MRLLQVSFGEDDEATRMVVELSAREMALIYGFMGPTAPLAVSERAGVEWGNLFSDLAGDIGSIGARFYDGGWEHPRGLGLAVALRPASRPPEIVSPLARAA